MELTSFPAWGSVTVTTRSAATSRSTCLIPLGQEICISLATAFAPSPKCTRGSLDEAYPVLVVAWLYCTEPSAAVNRIFAPIPIRLLFVPASFSRIQ